VAISNRTRWRIFERDDFKCRYCGRRAPNVELAADHAFPRSKGGSDTEENLVTACVGCNSSKGTRILRGLYDERRTRRAYVLSWMSSAFRGECGVIWFDADFDYLTTVSPLRIYEAVWRTRVWLDTVREYPNRESAYQHVLSLLRLDDSESVECSA
jgi:hypothetical protein